MKKRTWALLLPIGAAVLLSGAAIFDYSVAAENTEAIRSAVEASSQLEEKSTTEGTETSSTSTSSSTQSTASSAEVVQSTTTPSIEAETEESLVVAEPEAVAEVAAPVQETVSAPVEPAAVSTVAAEQAAPVAETSAPTYQAMTIYMGGQAIPYQNGGTGSGQSIIDSNPNGVAATWGGAAIQSGDDGLNTHIIGHNPGAFSVLFSLGSGSQIIVTDGAGTPTTYTVQSTMQVNDYGTEVSSGQDVWDLTVGTGGGERITLQTCVNDDVNLFVLAYK